MQCPAAGPRLGAQPDEGRSHPEHSYNRAAQVSTAGGFLVLFSRIAAVCGRPRERSCVAGFRMTTNEWLKSRQAEESHWLYVVWDAMTPGHELVPALEPGHRLADVPHEARSVRQLEQQAEAIAQIA